VVTAVEEARSRPDEITEASFPSGKHRDAQAARCFLYSEAVRLVSSANLPESHAGRVERAPNLTTRLTLSG